MRCSDLPYEKSSPAFNRMIYGDGGGGRETSRDYHIRAEEGEAQARWWLGEGTMGWRHVLRWTVGLINGIISLV